MKKFTNRHGCLWIIPLLFLGIFYFYPLFKIIGISFTRADTGVVNVFIDALSTPTVRKVLWFSLWQALLSTLLTLLVGLPGAYLLARFKFRGKALLRALSSVPFVMPTLVVASAFNALLGPRGWINLGLMDTFNLAGPPIKFVNTLTAILVAHIFYNTTIVLRMVGDFWSHLDSRLTQASQVLGANRWQTWWLVTFPIISPVIAAAALLVFVFNFSSFGVILVLGGPQFSTLEVEIYYQTISLFNLPVAAVLSVIQLATTMTLLLIYTRLSRRLSQPLSLRASQANQLPLNTWARRIFASLVIGFMIVFFISPLAGLAARSFTRLEPDLGQRTFSKGLTVDFYRALSVNENNSSFYAPPTTAVAISLQFALVTVVFSLLIGLPAAWALTHQKDSKFTRLLDLIYMLPLGTSAVTLGFGFIVALNHPPLDLRASPWMIPLAHTLVALPFVVRSLTPALRSIQPQLRQAAAVLGAAPRQVWRHIDLPLVGKAILVASTFAFTISLGEFGATALVSRPEYPTIPIMIYRFLSQPGGLNYGRAMALSTILMLVTTLSMLSIERFRVGKIGEF